MSLTIYLNEIWLYLAAYPANILFLQGCTLKAFILGLSVKIAVYAEEAVLAFFDDRAFHNSLLA